VMAVGERVRLDGRRARVVRTFPGGVALKFENWVEDVRDRCKTFAPTCEPRARRA
jgi:hypothetical protein